MGGKGSGGYRKNALPKDKNPIIQANDPTKCDPKANTQVIGFMKAAMAIGTPDFTSPESIEEHFYKFLDVCDKCEIVPMIGSYAASMGLRHQEFNGILSGDPHYKYIWNRTGLTPESQVALQKCYDFLKISWESALMTDKGNPVKWIFLGKNYFGMKDQSERVNYHVDAPQQLPSADDVADKYKAMVGRQEPIKGELESVEDVPESTTN